MESLVWKDELSLGVDALDNDHKLLVNLVNEFYIAILSSGYSAEVIVNRIYLLLRDTKEHFSREERWMRDAKYPEYSDHKMEHEDLIEEVNEMILGFIKYPTKNNAEKLYGHLSEWLVNHIITYDALVATHIKNSKGITGT